MKASEDPQNIPKYNLSALAQKLQKSPTVVCTVQVNPRSKSIDNLTIAVLKQILAQLTDTENPERVIDGLSTLLKIISKNEIFDVCFQEDFILFLATLITSHPHIMSYLIYGLSILQRIVSSSPSVADYLFQNTPIIDSCIRAIPLPASLSFLEKMNVSQNVSEYLTNIQLTQQCLKLLQKHQSSSYISFALLHYIDMTFEQFELSYNDALYFVQFLKPFYSLIRPSLFQIRCLEFIHDNMNETFFQALVQTHFVEQFYQQYLTPSPPNYLCQCMDLIIKMSTVEGSNGNDGALYLSECDTSGFITHAYQAYEQIKVHCLNLVLSLFVSGAPIFTDELLEALDLNNDNVPFNVQTAQMTLFSALVQSKEKIYLDMAMLFNPVQKILAYISMNDEQQIQLVIDALISIFQEEQNHPLTEQCKTLLDNEDFRSAMEGILHTSQNPETLEKVEAILNIELDS